ncbi:MULTISPECIES: DDE-type integrase/transposase/recombinase [Pseudomonadaceae]|uniref:Integrase core domain-containing protein n=1 Tax=Ectopseudomonas composti TaxID=658457 RepID=A0A1I5L4L5_9GAMM|nr:DDE-type integrase/transposase/recombinase [Pseudomonas composti]SFO92138.1 Integrase core domain-containing protein [Pseudomonas composti]
MNDSTRFSRREFLAAGNSCDAWRCIDVDLIAEDIREATDNRIKAIRAYLKNGATLREIEDAYGLSRATLYRSINRCLALDTDGVVIGFKGAIPYRRIGEKKYNREKDLGYSNDGVTQGDAGAFSKLIADHPEIKSWLEKIARNYKPRSQGGVSFDVIHNAFLVHCTSLSISNDQYPFNRKTLARSALREHLRSKSKELKALDEKERNASDINYNVPPTDILQQVETDGHMLDIRLVIEELDSFGQPIRYEILRVWLILLIDVFSRCVLGYSIALGHTYDQIDLLKAIFNSLTPHQKQPLITPNVHYSTAGGFPSEHGYAWETWSTLKLDNAWAHKATNVVRVLHDRVGCVAEFGRPHTPNDRAIIERFFLFVVQHYSHRIIGTTGSDSRDKIIERLSPKSKNPLKLLLTLEELKSTIDILISDYNGRPHSSLQGHSPLGVFCLCGDQNSLPPNTLPDALREPTLFSMARESVVVRTSSKYGGAYVNFAYLKYKNPDVLRSDSVGRHMFVEYSREDVSFLRLLDEDGTFVGVLRAPHPWYLQPHSLKVRSELWKATKQGQFQFARNETPTEAFRRLKLATGDTSRRVATTLYKETGRVSEDPSSVKGRDGDTPERLNHQRVKLTKVFTL